MENITENTEINNTEKEEADNTINENSEKTANEPSVKLTAETLPFINLALQNNGKSFVLSILLENGSTPIENAVFSVSSNPEFIQPYTKQLDYIPENQAMSLSGINPIINASYLAGLTERVNGVVTFTLSADGKALAEQTKDIAVLAFDQWHGSGFYPELLCSFITPNHPEIPKLIADSARLLNEWTGSPSFDAYQTKDPNRAIKQAAAVYAAIKQQNIVYAVAPASYEVLGQRVRLCDSVLAQKMGNCLDMTLLYCSCLEAVGLHPLLILTEGHIFSGLWLEDLTFPQSVQDDTSLITKRLAGGINEIAVIETTLLCAGKNLSFDQAMAAGESELSGINAAECIIDVARARLSGIRPLPVRVKNANGEYEIDQSALGKPDAVLNAPKELGEAVNVTESDHISQLPKKAQWERKLLDLGLRNPLINLRLSRTVIPVLTTSLGDLEDALADGGEFMIMPKPDEWKPQGEAVDFENIGILGDAGELIKSEFANKRLRSVCTEAELSKQITQLYRTSKTALEENGANTLYLALGLLRWFETEKSPKPRYAPVVLLPVDIVRKSALKGYVIRLRDDEPQMNITMLEKMKQDFGITVSGLDPLPLDQHGIDMRTVFAVLRKAVMGQSRWDILESAYLGIFSFSQFVMWNDIRNRSDDLEKNKIVKSLIDGKLVWDAGYMEIGERVEESGVLTPMAADASQLFAIKSACQGKSFVLHGPPGTGKSQTITSLIANVLAEGKSVLFAAEKMAALEVVQKRLDKIGIGAFCLELHSNKARKKEVLEQLRIASEVTKTVPPSRYKEKAEQIQKKREELNLYSQSLHKPLNCGSTVFELINKFEDYKDAADIQGFTSEFTSTLTLSDIEELDAAVNRLAAAGTAAKSCSKDISQHPLMRVELWEYSQQLKTSVPPKAAKYKEALNNLISYQEKLLSALSIQAPKTLEEEKSLLETAELLSAQKTLPLSWRTLPNASFVFTQIAETAQAFISLKEKEQELLKIFNPAFLQQDGCSLLNEYNAINAKWALPKAVGLSSMAKRLGGFAKTAVQKENLLQYINGLCECQQEKSKADGLFAQTGAALGELYGGEQTDWLVVQSCAKSAKDFCHKLSQKGISEEKRIALLQNSQITEASDGFKNCFENMIGAKDDIYALLKIAQSDNNQENWILSEISLCDNILNNVDALKEWTAFNTAVRETEQKGLKNIADEYKMGIDEKELFPAYKKSLLLNLINTAIDNDKVLSGFSGAVFNQRIEDLKNLDKEITELSKEEIFCRLAANLPDFTKEAAANDEIGILQKMIKSGGRGVSIRKMFEKLPTLIPRLCPCMLMSPISAAQYLDPNREPFDLVVFDEASQLTTCKAVGVLARGKDAVIVGDPRQMPPTSFFATNSTDEDNLETEDLESILDDCLALNMPQTHLLWHYRSRHESLIAFSNSRFYENKLFTFPSVNDRESKVNLIHIDGVFDRGKTRQNRAEAEAVVEEIKRRCHDEVLSKNSIGVVTFNISQQNLIEDLLNEACKTDQQLEQWAFNSDEPVFIKNLENVQGDERDVILFSVGYGPDKDGNVFMNFGPLNRDGGWRRLNVAVSRARCEMAVFSTLTADQINLSKTGAEGVAALKAFLDYAAGKPLALSEYSADKYRKNKENIAKSISRELKSIGYDSDLSVGHSGYRIDIGVIDPDNKDKYILGILLDGDCYNDAKTTRDREIAQISVLNGLGWDIMRVWTMDWWDNRQKEIGRIHERLLQNKRQPQA